MSKPPKDLREIFDRPSPRPLIGIAQGVDDERYRTIKNLNLILGVDTAGEVLNWCYEAGALWNAKPARVAEICAAKDISRASVFRAFAFWKKHQVLRFEDQIDDRGSPMPSLVSIDWDRIVALLIPCGTSRPQMSSPVSHRDETTPVSNETTPVSNETTPVSNETRVSHAKDETTPVSRETGVCGEIEQFSYAGHMYPRTCAGALAWARAAVTVVTVTAAAVAVGVWGEVEELAAEQADELYPGTLPPDAWQLLCTAAFLAIQGFGKKWLIDSVAATVQANKDGIIERTPRIFLLAVLRDNCERMEIVKDVPANWNKWFGKLTWIVEKTVQARAIKPPKRESVRDRQTWRTTDAERTARLESARQSQSQDGTMLELLMAQNKELERKQAGEAKEVFVP